MAPDYLGAIHAFFGAPGRWGAVLDYAHPVEGASPETRAILAYELYLRYHAMGLRHAGSPYAFHSIGSTMACTARAYAQAGGMNRRAVAEDFYFLQALAKTGPVGPLRGTVVRPSARRSTRTPFGTGRQVARFAAGEEAAYLFYDPDCYEVLRRWLVAVAGGLDAGSAALLEKARGIDEQLERFLALWAKLEANAANGAQLLAQFHRWFDGLRSLRLIHHLRDHGRPRVGAFEAIPRLMERVDGAFDLELGPDMEKDLDAQRVLLESLRARGREHPRERQSPDWH